eukprot:TRINITY_DN17612_c0_g1_i1.p1 TRINITY_DN17612_c0_g1~~TRINITY_DN17612_c0_g1_i1.p1  ORF type:complete len:378 (+),score=72.53 TRINITY_DN17612_c0_g1_i1:55-1188(+)
MEYEHALLKAPVEHLAKLWRAQHKWLEKDGTVVENAMKTLIQRESAAPNVQNTCASLDKIITKLRGVKRKLEEAQEERCAVYQMVHIRLDHLRMSRTAPVAYREKRVHRLVADYLMREHSLALAQTVRDFCGLQGLLDEFVFEPLLPVLESLRKHSCTEALAWVKENQPKLKRLKNTVEFSLRLQEYVVLVQEGKRMDAVEYARKHLSLHSDTRMDEIKQALALVAFPQRAIPQRYQFLFAENRWASLVDQLKQAAMAVYGLPTTPLLLTIMQSGILALNTQQAQDPASFNVNDPMCDKNFQELARPLPMTQRKNSTLICRISGEVMDSENIAMVLPNGQVYSHDALWAMHQTSGEIRCPTTQQTFKWSQVKKAFIM